MAYCLKGTLEARLKRSASGLTPRSLLGKFAAVQMLDVHLPTTDGREVVLTATPCPRKTCCSCLINSNSSSPTKPHPRSRHRPRPQIEKIL